MALLVLRGPGLSDALTETGPGAEGWPPHYIENEPGRVVSETRPASRALQIESAISADSIFEAGSDILFPWHSVWLNACSRGKGFYACSDLC